MKTDSDKGREPDEAADPAGLGDRVAVSPQRAAELLDCSREMIFAEIAAGRLIARKVSKTKTLIPAPELPRWLNSFPTTVEARQGA
jgi:hypothetical protein